MKSNRSVDTLAKGQKAFDALLAEFKRFGYAKDVMEYRFQRVMQDVPRGTPRWVAVGMASYWHAIDPYRDDAPAVQRAALARGHQ